MTNPIFFKVYKGISPELLSGKPYHIFKDLKNTLTDPILSIGVHEKIFRNQDSDGNITLPKGYYTASMQFDFILVNVRPSDYPAKILYLMPNFKFFVDGLEVNDKCDHKSQCRNNTIPIVLHQFAITKETGTFRIDIKPSVFVEDKEDLAIRFRFQNIVITIHRIVELPDAIE